MEQLNYHDLVTTHAFDRGYTVSTHPLQVGCIRISFEPAVSGSKASIEHLTDPDTSRTENGLFRLNLDFPVNVKIPAVLKFLQKHKAEILTLLMGYRAHNGNMAVNPDLESRLKQLRACTDEVYTYPDAFYQSGNMDSLALAILEENQGIPLEDQQKTLQVINRYVTYDGFGIEYPNVYFGKPEQLYSTMVRIQKLLAIQGGM